MSDVESVEWNLNTIIFTCFWNTLNVHSFNARDYNYVWKAFNEKEQGKHSLSPSTSSLPRWKWGLVKWRLTNVFGWHKLLSLRNTANVKIQPDTLVHGIDIMSMLVERYFRKLALRLWITFANSFVQFFYFLFTNVCTSQNYCLLCSMADSLTSAYYSLFLLRPAHLGWVHLTDMWSDQSQLVLLLQAVWGRVHLKYMIYHRCRLMKNKNCSHHLLKVVVACIVINYFQFYVECE